MPEKTVILGYGRSGQAAAALAMKHGDNVVVIDEGQIPAPAPWREGVDFLRSAVPETFSGARRIVVSPGISMKSPSLRLATESGIETIGELEYGFRHCSLPVLAITGTNGKTTTTEWTCQLFERLGIPADTAGNIGRPLCDAVLDPGKTRVLVVEVSSFQLELPVSDTDFRFSPRAAALLNITSDHADRYASEDTYAATKFRIFRNVSGPDSVILNANLLPFWERHSGQLPFRGRPVWFQSRDPGLENADWALRNGSILFRGKPLVPLSEIRFLGRHNVENLMASLSLLVAFTGESALEDSRLLDGIRELRTGAHRLELVEEKDGIRYVNDSKATNPDSVIVALDALGENQNVRLILGGLDKNMDFSVLRACAPKIRKAYVQGACRETIIAALRGFVTIESCSDFDTAVTAACREAEAGEVVLLSPACASMDRFRDYRERGDRFANLVREH